MNIILTGMRGTGKTTLGKMIAQAGNRPFLDLDEVFEERHGPIQAFVQENGWDAFRDLEHEIAKELAEKKRHVIASGGGTMMYKRNEQVLKPSGVVILLHCNPAVARKNLMSSYKRPSLKQQESAIDEWTKVWEERKEKYHAVADHVHDTSQWPNHEELIEVLRKIPKLKWNE